MKSIEACDSRTCSRPCQTRLQLSGLRPAGNGPKARSRGRVIARLSVRFIVLAATAGLLWTAPVPSRAQDLYVASQFSSTVAEYNATTGAAINPSFITGLFKPQNLALSGNTLFVTNLINSNFWTVGEYNATAGAAVNPLLIAGIDPPQGLAVSKNALYISSSNTVGEYNPATGAAIDAAFISLRVPEGLAISGNNLYVLYVSGTNSLGSTRPASFVSEYNATTGVVINPALVTGLVEPKGLAISGNNLYVGSAFSDTVGQYNATTGTAIKTSLITAVNPPQGLAISDSRLYVLYLSGTYAGSYVGEYDAATGAAINASLITGLVQPTGIAVSPPAPVVTSTLSATGTDGLAFRYRIIATNSPTAYHATGLPAGLRVDTSTGLISGKPKASGTFPVTISASNAAGRGSEALALTILPPLPAITSALTVVSTYGAPFNYRITARNSPTRFDAAGLPTGLKVDTSTGLISGTAFVSGTFPVSISVSNAGGTASAMLAVTVNFNGIKGSYAGLAAIGGTTAGFFTLSLTPRGDFTGRLTLGGAAYSLKGVFSSTGTYNGILSTGASTLDVVLNVDPSLPEIAGTITVATAGGITSYTIQSGLLGELARAHSPGLAGRYTAILPGASGTDPTLPHAPGYGTMTVSITGAVRIAGKLGDGTAFTLAGQLHADGKTCTLFSPLYGRTNPGSIAGNITFETSAGSDWDGVLDWIKPAQEGTAYYPAGFQLAVDLLAAKYAPPPLASGPVTFTVGGGDMPSSSISASLAISSRGSVNVSGINNGSVTLILTPRTGAFSGTLLDPGANKGPVFNGVIYQKPVPAGFGLFLATGRCGGVEITQ
jgi:hypothetical protein